MGISEFENWIKSILGSATYTYQKGMWVESAATAAILYCCIQGAGGPAPDVEDRRPRYRVILLGRRGERADGTRVLADAEALMQATMGDSAPCGAANVRATGEPVGPGFTTENRAWVQVEFEVLF